jgi:hypothetical protein
VLKSWLPLAAATVIPFFATETVAYVYPGHPTCPWADVSHTWAKFLNKEYGGPDPMFSIQFTRDIGDIQRGECYLIIYHGNENWLGSGKIRGQNKSKPEGRHGGDPAKYQINVWGAQFTYNEAGEVFYVADGKLAGNMYCHIGSECWK